MIFLSRLEAEARKESTMKNAEAAAQAKVIDSKAELERRNLLAEAEVPKRNPLLIQKIIAKRLSDKVQSMMVPMDGKFFFTNDVLRGTPALSLNKPDAP